MQAISLRTEYLNNPVAIDIARPRFFWKCQAAGNNRAQSAYRIIAWLDDGAPLWDSGKAESSRMTHILYEGTPLQSRNRVLWKVKLWDEKDTEGEWSETAFFEVGLLDANDWAAKWIAANLNPDSKIRYPADAFKKTFDVTKELSKARLYITACGLYTATINGKRVGNDCFTPGYTQYEKRIQYQTYDVKELLQTGSNELVAVLGDGWFRGSIGAYNITNAYGSETKLLAQLELVFVDGTTQTIGTGEDFLWCNDGPIRENDLKNGELFDANRNFSYWYNAKLTSYSANRVCSNNVPVREMERLTAALLKTPNGETVLDFSQNIAGYVEFKTPDVKGHTVTLRFGEMLDQNGNFTQFNFQISSKPQEQIKQQVTYICSDRVQIYKPSFSLFGFRYVLVENWPGEIDPADFTAIAVYSAMQETGDFTCGNELVNQLLRNTRWSMKGNYLDVPTDCPQRERNPWTGDAQVFFETGSMLMDTAPFIRKWLHDVQDAQREDGAIRNIAPHAGEKWIVKSLDGSVGWADSIVLIPYRYYKIYGDEQILSEFYPAMQRYAEFMIKRAKKPGITSLFKQNPYKKYTYASGQHWGEWAEPKEDRFEGYMALGFPRPEEATAYMAHTMSCMSQIAGILGKQGDAARYAEYAQGAKKAYNYLFVQNYDIRSIRPAKLVRPLALGLLDEPAKTNVAKRLALLIEKRTYKIGTGFLSTPFVLKTLAVNGYPEHAIQMLLQEQSPGWLYPVKQGATTIWENWEMPDEKQRGSLNHYSKGSVCYWLFNSAAGIEISGKEATFIIRPHVYKELANANAEYDSIYGKVKSEWTITQGVIRFAFEIPANTTALICLPDGSCTVGSGTYHFEIIEGEKNEVQ